MDLIVTIPFGRRRQRPRGAYRRRETPPKILSSKFMSQKYFVDKLTIELCGMTQGPHEWGLGLAGGMKQKVRTFIDIYIKDICGENHLACDNWLQRPRGAYRWRETPVAASWGKAQTD